MERLGVLVARFPLPWSHYVRLLAVKDENARHFYEQEALRGEWSIRQLDRQIGSQFYERTLLRGTRPRCSAKSQAPKERQFIAWVRQPQDPETRRKEAFSRPQAGRQTRALAQPSCHPDWGSERGRARVAWVILGLTPPGYERSPLRGWENTDDLQPVNPLLWVACGRCERKPLWHKSNRGPVTTPKGKGKGEERVTDAHQPGPLRPPDLRRVIDFWTTPRRRGNAPCRSRYAALGSGSSNRASCGGTWTLGGSSSLLYKAWISTV